MNCKWSVCLVLVVFLAAPAFAQESVVAQVKTELVAKGVSLEGACGAFSITKRVAWTLRSTGVGLLSKPQGNNCEGYSVDFLTYPDGSGIDILGDSGGANVPAWGESEPPGTLTGRWRPPVDPGDGLSPQPPPIVTPLDPGIELELLQRLSALQEQVRHIDAKLDVMDGKWEGRWKAAGKFAAKYAPILLGAIYAGRATAK